MNASSVVRATGSVPFWFKLFEDFAFGVIANDPGVDESAQVKALCPEMRHLGNGSGSRLRDNGVEVMLSQNHRTWTRVVGLAPDKGRITNNSWHYFTRWAEE